MDPVFVSDVQVDRLDKAHATASGENLDSITCLLGRSIKVFLFVVSSLACWRVGAG